MTLLFWALNSEVKQMKTVSLHGFSDANFAPYRFNKRRGISGGATFFERSLVRSMSRQQQALSFSSCEAELYAIQAVCQEAIAFGKLTQRLLFRIGELDKSEPVTVWLESDSASALQLLQSVDVPKKSRHVEIRLLWMKEQLSKGGLHLRHRPGVSNPADIFTKCLGTRLFLQHRYTLGLVQFDGLVTELRELGSLKKEPVWTLAFVEACCSEYSNLRHACEYSKVPYVGVVANMQSKGTLSRVQLCIQQWETKPLWVHVHASTPCASGSPLKNFNKHVVSTSDQEWDEVMNSVEQYLALGCCTQQMSNFARSE